MTASTLDSGFVWLVIALLAAGTFAIRLSFIQLFEFADEAPPWPDETLRFVPVAVLTALVLPHFVTLESASTLAVTDERLLAGTAAAVVAWRTEHMLATIAVGMGVLWLAVLVL